MADPITKAYDRLMAIDRDLPVELIRESHTVCASGECGAFWMVEDRARPHSAPELTMIWQRRCRRGCAGDRARTYCWKALVPATAVGRFHIGRTSSGRCQGDLVTSPEPLAAVPAPEVGQLHPDAWDGHHLQFRRAESDCRKAGDCRLAKGHGRRLAPA